MERAQLHKLPRPKSIALVVCAAVLIFYTLFMLSISNSVQGFITAWLFPGLAIGIGVLVVLGLGVYGSSLSFAMQIIITSISVSLWSAIVLAELGIFSLLALDIVLLVFGITIGIWLRKRKHQLRPLPRPHLTKSSVFLLIILSAAATLFGISSEQITGGSDPGVYVITGINVARTGRIAITDNTLAAPPKDTVDNVLYTALPNTPFRDGHSFPAYYVTDAEEGSILSQFLPFFVIAIAILYEIGGIQAALYATPIFAWLSVLTLFLLGRKLVNSAVGLLSAALLTLNISQIWFARIPFAEASFQFLLLSGLWTLALCIEQLHKGEGSPNLLAVLSAACFGLAHLTKLDSYVVPLIALGFSGVSWLLGEFRLPHTLFTGCYLLLGVHATTHVYLFNTPYAYDVFHMFEGYAKIAGMGLLLAVPILILIVRFRARLVTCISAMLPRLAPLKKIFVGIIIILCLHLYFVRPMLANLGTMSDDEIVQRGAVITALRQLAFEPETFRYPGKEVRTYIEEGMPRFGWYMTPLGVWLGIAGFLIWSTSSPKPQAVPFLVATFLYSALVFYKGSVVSEYFWAFKRYVPLVIPAFAVLVAYTLWQLYQIQQQFRILAIVLTTYLLCSYVIGGLTFWGHVEYKGAIQDLTELAEQFPDNAVILFEQSDTANRIGTPLAYIFDKTVFPVAATSMRTVQMQYLVGEWQSSGRPVYWISSKDTEITLYGPTTYIGEKFIEWPEAAIELKKLPQRINQAGFRLRIWQIVGSEYTIPTNLNVNFDNQIILLGSQVQEAKIAAGETLHLNLYWYGKQKLRTDYTVFVHLIDETATLWGQKDSQPLEGTRPTSGWRPGEIIHDSVEIPVQPDTPPGNYKLYIGLYDLATMERLPIQEHNGPIEITNNGVILGKIQVNESTDKKTLQEVTK